MITKPTLVIFVGPPGSGKTHIAVKFSQRNGFVHVNSDSVRAKYFVNPQFTPEERERVYAKIYETVDVALGGGSNVVFDGNLLTNKNRFEVMERYKRMGAEVLFVFLNIPSKIAIKRALARKTSDDGLYNAMPVERAERMHQAFEPLDSRLPQVTITDTGSYAGVEKSILDGILLLGRNSKSGEPFSNVTHL